MASSLPDELWHRIMELGVHQRRLSFKELCYISMSSPRLRRLSAAPSLWYSLLCSDYPSETWDQSSSSPTKSLYKTRKLTMFPIGKLVEVKGFGRWLGTTLVGNVVGYFNKKFYIINLWSVIDPDYTGNYDDGRRDDEYYLIKQDQFQIIHPHFIRDTSAEKSGRHFNIGDVVAWDDICTIRKAVVIDKTFHVNEHLNHPNEQWTYTVILEDSGEIEQDYSYRISPYREWI